jgi:Na+-translocating ferredoxin:NAD+ oxidoreductase subunit B
VAGVLLAVLILGGLALFFGAVLATAHRLLYVEEDPRLEHVSELLPGNNCGACGVPGCAAFAGELVEGVAEPGACTVANAGTLAVIAEFLGVDVGGGDRRIARLRCAGGEGLVGAMAEYRGHPSCRSAVLVNGGGRSCVYGCLGLADCDVSCSFDAIAMGADGLPHVDGELCTACGDCVDACPLDLFILEPREQSLFVACASPLDGEEARALCAVACDACGRCAADAPEVVEMSRGLPVIHWDRDTSPSVEATWRCPTGAIVWRQDEPVAPPTIDAAEAPRA